MRPALAGALATVPMSAVMLLGPTGQQPPDAITRTVLARLGARPGERTADVLAAAAHLAMGAGLGAVLPRLPRVGPAPVRGVVLALAVWAASYQGWVPALGALPPASRDRRDRVVVMVAAHVVFGGVLGALTGPASPRPPR